MTHRLLPIHGSKAVKWNILHGTSIFYDINAQKISKMARIKKAKDEYYAGYNSSRALLLLETY